MIVAIYETEGGQVRVHDDHVDNADRWTELAGHIVAQAYRRRSGEGNETAAPANEMASWG